MLSAVSMEPTLVPLSPLSLSAPLFLSLPSPAHSLSFSLSKINKHWGAWVAQLVKRPTSAQVMISHFEPRIRLCADSSEPGACFRFCVSLALCPSPARTLSLSKINKWWGTWVAQLVKRPTSAQVMVSRFMSSSPT